MSPTLRQKMEHEEPAGDEQDPESDDKPDRQRELLVFLLFRHELTPPRILFHSEMLVRRMKCEGPD